MPTKEPNKHHDNLHLSLRPCLSIKRKKLYKAKMLTNSTKKEKEKKK